MIDTREKPLSDLEFLALDAERPRREVIASDNTRVKIVQMQEPDCDRLLLLARKGAAAEGLLTEAAQALKKATDYFTEPLCQYCGRIDCIDVNAEWWHEMNNEVLSVAERLSAYRKEGA